MSTRHFIDLKDIDAMTLRALIDKAREMKDALKIVSPLQAGGRVGGQHLKTTPSNHHPAPSLNIHALRAPHDRSCKEGEGDYSRPLSGKKLAMIFEKHSTRTRVSFEAGMLELGGHALNLTRADIQLGRGESIADTARVLSRYTDAIMMRATDHHSLLELAKYADVPVINGLTDLSHPCQVMADVLTFEEHSGSIQGATIAWIGDGNNVCNSWITAAVKFGFTLRIAGPKDLRPHADYLAFAAGHNASVAVMESSADAVRGAEAVVTDAWVSMGTENSETRKQLLRPYQVDEKLMTHAAKDAIFLHCLPAHRGEEVTAGVIDGAQSVVWDEAENRLHAQKAILIWCMHGE